MTLPLTDERLERYKRHILLREIGGRGQQRLLAARVLLVGAGGIGSPAALYLAAAGVGTLGIVDDDHVALSNLQRQILFDDADVGDAKLDAAERRLKALNPDVTLELHPQRLTPANARDLVTPYDLVLDGCDNFETRLAVNEACVALGKPLVSAAIGEFTGQIAVFKSHEKAADGEPFPCYRCFVSDDPQGAANCTDQGVVGALAGVVGTWAALEAVKEIARFGESLAGGLVLFDGLASTSRRLRLRRDPACPCCGRPPP